MKFGICDSDLNRIPISIAAGIDYVEMGVSNTLVPLEPEATWKPIKERIQALGVKPEAWNLFFPATVRITGPQVDWDLVQRYAATAVERAASVGGKVMVVGSGGARNVPEGFSWDEAWAQLVHAFRLLGQEAAKWDVIIAIEPLRRQESNIVNYVSEGVMMAKEVNHPNVRVLADFYHIVEGDEPLEHLLEAAPYLAHVHVADSGRLYPGSGSYDYRTFMRYLRRAGYDARISMEGRWNYEKLSEEATAGLAFLRRMWEEAAL